MFLNHLNLKHTIDNSCLPIQLTNNFCLFWRIKSPNYLNISTEGGIFLLNSKCNIAGKENKSPSVSSSVYSPCLSIPSISAYLYLFISISIYSCSYIIIIIIMLCYQHRYPWPSLATPPYDPLLPAGLQSYILYRHRAAVCRFKLVILPLLGHVKGSTGVHHLWARPYFSSSVPHACHDGW